MNIEWARDDSPCSEPGEWRWLGRLPDRWYLSVLHRLTGFGMAQGCRLFDTETALGHKASDYFGMMAGDIRDSLTGNESLADIKALIEGSPGSLADQIVGSVLEAIQ